jgi:hypothetical protein
MNYQSTRKCQSSITKFHFFFLMTSKRDLAAAPREFCGESLHPWGFVPDWLAMDIHQCWMESVLHTGMFGIRKADGELHTVSNTRNDGFGRRKKRKTPSGHGDMGNCNSGLSRIWSLINSQESFQCKSRCGGSIYTLCNFACAK